MKDLYVSSSVSAALSLLGVFADVQVIRFTSSLCPSTIAVRERHPTRMLAGC